MLKKYLAMIAIGSLVTGISFATPVHTFMKNSIVKSSIASKHHTQNAQSKFPGTWEGTCTYGSESDSVKIRIMEDEFHFSITDLVNDGWSDVVSFNSLESKTSTDNDSYESSVNRTTKINENTIKYESTIVLGTPDHPEERLASAFYTSTFVVNNNQLTIESVMKFADKDQKGSVDKCILKRVG